MADHRQRQNSQEPDDTARKATRSPGSVGGRSGNGQMKPHQRYDRDQDSSDEGLDSIVPEAIGVDADAGKPMHNGGSAIDREVRIQERKQKNDAGGRSGRRGAGGMDPPPGAPTRKQ
jgi:hypothetical protein